MFSTRHKTEGPCLADAGQFSVVYWGSIIMWRFDGFGLILESVFVNELSLAGYILPKITKVLNCFNDQSYKLLFLWIFKMSLLLI